MVVLGQTPVEFQLKVQDMCKQVYDGLLKAARPVLQHGDQEEVPGLGQFVVVFYRIKVHAFRDAAMLVVQLMHANPSAPLCFFFPSVQCRVVRMRHGQVHRRRC